MNEVEFRSRYDFHEKNDYIGSGGFSNVFKAKDTIHENEVAIKISPVNPAWGGFTLKREVEIVNSLQPIHKNIARYESCYRFTNLSGSTDFAILKFYELGNLDKFLINNALNIDEKEYIIRGILSGVAFLHQKKIIHRDLKASNILIAKEKEVLVPKITDFGQARKTAREALMENSAIAVSYHYAAPEQIDNKEILMNVDLWSVGILIYRIMTGQLPFRSDAPETTLTMLQKIKNVDLPKDLYDLPEPYKSLILKCLVKDVKKRVQKAEDLLKLMDDYYKPLKINELEEDRKKAAMLLEKIETRLQEEEQTRLKEEERTRLKADEERTRLKAEAERTRLKAEAERARLKAEEEAEAERNRLKAEEEAEAERTRLKAEEEAEAERNRLKAEEEANRLKPNIGKYFPFLSEMDKEVKLWVGVTLTVIIICGIFGYCNVPNSPTISRKESRTPPPPQTESLPTDNLLIVRQQIIEQLCNAGINKRFSVNMTVHPNGSVDSTRIIYNCTTCNEQNKTLIKITTARLKLPAPINNGNPVVYNWTFDSDSIKCTK
jgi:serine/threonine protein kinase